MQLATFEGASDDLIEIEGVKGGDEFSAYPKDDDGVAGVFNLGGKMRVAQLAGLDSAIADYALLRSPRDRSAGRREGLSRRSEVLIRCSRRGLTIANHEESNMTTHVSEGQRETLENHVLDLHVDTPQLKAWYLRDPRREVGRINSVMILATREGIVIVGDLCPGEHGALNAGGYDIDWFARQRGNDEDYICSKFLRRTFVPEYGAAELRRRIVERRRESPDYTPKSVARDAFDAVSNAEKWHELSAERAYTIATDADIEFDSLGYGWDPVEAGWLCAIQQRFAALYAELAERAA